MMFSSAKIAFVFLIAFAFMQIGSRAGPHASGILESNIKEICSQSPDPVECPNILKSDPELSNIYHLEELSDRILAKAREDARDAIELLDTFKSKDPVLQCRYSACDKFYNKAFAAIDQLRSGDFEDLVLKTKTALDIFKQCIDQFAKEKYLDPNHIQEITVYLRNSVGIAYSTGKMLQKRSGH